MKQTIAIVEDDAQQRHYYAEALRAQQYNVIELDCRQSAIDTFSVRLPDLVILDIALNADVGGGYEVCRYLNERDKSLPVIFLTSRGDELDKIYGLQLGAWDYQIKPVSMEFLLVRIESFFNIKQRTSNINTDEADKETSDLRINKKSMQCFWKGEEIRLTPTEFSILSAILEAGEAISVDELVRATRQGVVEDNTINTHILHIRKKFKNIDAGFCCIQTRYGFGYQWSCE
ncbi:MAG TPA: response regulator [Gammaproteobacteria bacterium]|nr:response regulator [Gammaproteobacteria bacterium]